MEESRRAGTRPAGSDPLLTPLRIRHLELRNRVMSTSHACGLHDAGMPGERYQSYHEEKARGGIGLTMFGGSSNVAPDSPNIFQQLNVGVDAVIPHLQRFSERVHKHGAALMCQITHLGRRGESYAGDWLPTIAPSPIRETLHRSFPKEMDEHDIERVVAAYAAAAVRCKEGGLDGIETLTGGHLIGQFLSPMTNKRSDRFGGSLENRCRFGLMVYERIRKAVGDDFLVGMRFVVDEGVGGGLDGEECLRIATIFQESGLVDFFNAIYGRMDTERGLARDNMPGMDSPIAPWVRPVGEFKRHVKLPVFHAARIADVASARYAIAEGLLDMVGMTRAQIADPHLVNKLASGREEQIRPCVGATHCMSQYRPSCLHNAATGRETTLSHTISRSPRAGRKVVVVGGGPAGLEAARVAAERGHGVVLLEAAPALGGQVRIGAQGPWRQDLIGIVDWRRAELERLGVEVRLDTYASRSDVLALRPDVVVVATGGVPDLEWLEGMEHCVSAWDLLTGQALAANNVLVYDGTGRHPAPHAAARAAQAGSTVSLVTLDSSLALELTYAERVAWKDHCYKAGIAVVPDHRLVKVEKSGNRLIAHLENLVTQDERVLEVDQVVVEHGTRPVDELYGELRADSVNDGVTDIAALLAVEPQPRNYRPDAAFELYRVGDAVSSRNIHAAVYDSLRLCSTF
ncbi:MAG: FAD-dependent oxidoreductase [Rhizobiales bacterium]|nr:FAD-dependent oxidoreductase [Hyphomicrobiales bacterium]